MDSALSGLKPSVFKAVIDNLLNNLILKTICSVFLWTFGPRVHMVTVVFALVILDTITGVWKSAKAGQLSSKGFFKFSAKLMIYLVMLATGSLVDKSIPLPFAMPIMVSFLAFTEAVSILENVAILGWAVPTRLISMLKQGEIIEVKDK